MVVPTPAQWREQVMMRNATIRLGPLVWSVGAAPATEAVRYSLPPGSYAHDVAPAADGTVWYADQYQGSLGRFDPETGKAELIPLGPGSAPHGVVIGGDGGIWLTDGGQNAIVRVDPATKSVKVFRLPQEFANANLNTPVFDKRGIVWFTGQSGVYGRVDPATGKVEAWHAPDRKSV